MTDIALSNAETERKQLLERKKALLTELNTIDDRLGQIVRFVSSWYNFAGVAPPEPVDNAADSAENKRAPIHTPSAKRPKNSSKESVANLSLEIIRERQAPVSRSDLYKELTARGLVIEGKDNEMVLSTMLWRMDARIVRLKTGGYWERDKDWPEADYYPSLADELEREGMFTGLDEKGTPI
ncbi:hypothetical protein NKJ86_04915 [Mesorhizobium sp. M0025]|uniref:hypothetical protein n=1 Tax=unclassified Mesorhizobium TaxID=325217 RepID=UPI0033398F40